MDKTDQFIYKVKEPLEISSRSFSWKSPSNIALIKYWGKTGVQIPKNPSLSFTLSNCYTQTTLDFKHLNQPLSKPEFEIFFEGEKKESFKPKISEFLQRIEKYVPFIKSYHISITSENSFPHSSGIASSASSMAAIALCIMSLEKELNPNLSQENFYKKASFLARLGSGSACRSIQGPLVMWGSHHDFPESDDLFGIELADQVHPIFKNFNDTILLVDQGEKQVSSTVGHNLMPNNIFAEQRFQQANNHLPSLFNAMKDGNLTDFIQIVESEALSLHAMMMTSDPYFILMKPNTLKVIEKIWAFRKESNVPICFTLDAGANVHVLFPETHKDEANQFIISELVPFCQNNQYICDKVGLGAIQT